MEEKNIMEEQSVNECENGDSIVAIANNELALST